MTGLQPLFGTETNAGKPLIIAGPCSAETESQTLETARLLKADGIGIFRAGAWKPRTKPGGFEGRGDQALEWLRKVKDDLGMTVITEIATPLHLQAALGTGIENFWLGARTATNPFAVQDIADELSKLPDEKKRQITVLVKNPVNPDLELWIGALERIYNAGIRRLGAIHRGFSSYGNHYYRNEPRWALPIELSRRLPGLPIIFDPSHIAGKSELVEGLVKRAATMDYAGLMTEAHCNPAEALSDARQQITPEKLARILREVEYRKNTPKTEGLDALREKIDRIDEELIEILGKRMEISREIGAYKKEHGIPVIQNDRYRALMENRVAEGESLGLSPTFVRAILSSIHEESVRNQIDI